MASTPPTDQSFLREVDEAVRKEELLGFWRRFGRWIVVAVVAGLLAFGGWIAWKHFSHKASGEVSEQATKIFEAAAAGRQPDPQALAALSDADQSGYRAMALFAKAGAALNKGDAKGAAALFGQMAADEQLDRPYRDLALVRQTALEFDTLAPQTVVDRLKPLAQPGEAWFGSAGEMTAIAYMKMGKSELAGPLFAAIAKDAQAPESLRARARQMAGALGVDAADAADETAEAKE